MVAIRLDLWLCSTLWSVAWYYPPVVFGLLTPLYRHGGGLASPSSPHGACQQYTEKSRQRSSMAWSSRSSKQRVQDDQDTTTTTTAVKSGERIDLVALQQETLDNNPSVQVLSRDPLIYLVPDLLSAPECHAYRQYVQELERQGRPMTRSNPPHVSLQFSKLWPLPLLSLAAGIPPVVQLFSSTATSTSPHFESTTTIISISDILQASLPNVIAALILSATLAVTVLTVTRMVSNSSALLRTSIATALNHPDDIDLVRPLVDRVTSISQHAAGQWEAPVVTKYQAGAVFAKHGDASPQYGREWMDTGGQRIVTCICYLNTLRSGCGGETYFDRLDLTVTPQQGSGLFFFPANSVTWQADERTTHESLPTAAGQEKWIVQMFGRAERVPPPLGLPEAFFAK